MAPGSRKHWLETLTGVVRLARMGCMRVLAGLLLQALVLAHAAQPVQGVASYASGAPTPLQPPPEPVSYTHLTLPTSDLV